MNETPAHQIYVPPFYVAQHTVKNTEFELFDEKHTRPSTSPLDTCPVTCVSYGRAISYVDWLNAQTSMHFSLPNEAQFTAYTAPIGWKFPYQESGKPSRKIENVYGAYTNPYPGDFTAAVEVDNEDAQPNHLGIFHAGGNVSVFTLGHYHAEGHWGFNSDGAYAVIRGGNFRTCPYGARTVSRGVLDIAAITDTVGIRLVHPDPYHHLQNSNLHE